MSNFDDFADLNAAIAVQLEARQSTAEARAAKTRLSRLPANSAEAAADRAKIAEWESKHEWKAVGMIAVFEHETCEACDTTGERFVQFLQEEHHRRERGARRLQAKPAPIAGLPLRAAIQRRLVPMCPDCAPVLFDLDLSTAEEL